MSRSGLAQDNGFAVLICAVVDTWRLFVVAVDALVPMLDVGSKDVLVDAAALLLFAVVGRVLLIAVVGRLLRIVVVAWVDLIVLVEDVVVVAVAVMVVLGRIVVAVVVVVVIAVLLRVVVVIDIVDVDVVVVESQPLHVLSHLSPTASHKAFAKIRWH